MSESVYRKFRDILWRRRLSAEEQSELHAGLGEGSRQQAEWDEEMALSEALERLPDAPVPSNFTASVLQAVERNTARAEVLSASRFRWLWSILPKAAVATVLLGAGFLMYSEHAMARRTELAQSVAAVSGVTSLPDPAILQDFEAIRQLPPTPAPDDQLLALLK